MGKRLLLSIFLLGWAGAVTVTVQSGSTYAYDASSPIIRYVNSEKTVVAVQKITDRRLVLHGLKYGSAYVYIWTTDQKTEAIKVEVMGLPEKKSSVTRQQRAGKYELYFKSDPKNKTPVNQRMIVQKLSYRTEIDGYGLDTFFQYRYAGYQKDRDINQLESFWIRLSKNNNFLVVGDETVQYTELAGQNIGLQGAHGRYSFDKITVDVFSGKRPGEYWAPIVSDQAVQENEGAFLSGGRITAALRSNWQASLTFLRRDSNGKIVMLKDTTVTAVDTTFSLGKYSYTLETAANRAEDNNGKASRAEVEYNADTYGWRVTYRDIDPEYTSITDYLYYRGAKGVMLYGRVSPVSYLGLSGTYENYRQRYDKSYFSVINDNYTAEKARMRLHFMKLSFVQPSLTAYKSIGFESRWGGYSLMLDRIALIPQKLFYYFEFSPNKYEFSDSEYYDTQTTSGLQSYITQWWQVRLEQVSEFIRQVNGPGSTNPHGFNFITNFGDFTVPRTRIQCSLGYWFQNRKNSQGTLDKNRAAVKLSFHESMTPDFYWYLNGVFARENSLQYEFEERIGYFYQNEITQSEVSGGLSYTF